MDGKGSEILVEEDMEILEIEEEDAGDGSSLEAALGIRAGGVVIGFSDGVDEEKGRVTAGIRV